MSLLLERPVKLSFGRARHNVVVARSVAGELHVRLNEHFASAPDEISEALCLWLKNGKRARRASRLLDSWIEALNQKLVRQPRPAARIRQAGRVHQLEPLALEVIETNFRGELDTLRAGHEPWHRRVTWGRGGSRSPRKRRSIQLGSYAAEQRLIRIHPVLDLEIVPRFFLRYVLFHELLHAALDKRSERPEAPRARPHAPPFRQRERDYPEFERALDWQKANLSLLLSAARELARGRS